MLNSWDNKTVDFFNKWDSWLLRDKNGGNILSLENDNVQMQHYAKTLSNDSTMVMINDCKSLMQEEWRNALIIIRHKERVQMCMHLHLFKEDFHKGIWACSRKLFHTYHTTDSHSWGWLFMHSSTKIAGNSTNHLNFGGEKRVDPVFFKPEYW